MANHFLGESGPPINYYNLPVIEFGYLRGTAQRYSGPKWDPVVSYMQILLSGFSDVVICREILGLTQMHAIAHSMQILPRR